MSQRATYRDAADIARRIDQGEAIVIHEGYALQLSSWMEKHPGGQLAILHMVGRDATDEINAYHSANALQMMKRHRIGRIQEPWTNLVPPIRSLTYRQRMQLAKESNVTAKSHRRRRSLEVAVQGLLRPHLSRSTLAIPEVIGARGPEPDKPSSVRKRGGLDTTSERKVKHAVTLEEQEVARCKQSWPALDAATQRSIILEYRALHDDIKARGLYTCRYSNYGVESIRYGLLFAAFLYLLYIRWYLSSAVFLGLFWQQIMFTAHDAGHRGITGNFVIDTLIGAFVADFVCGLSIGWWKSSHNVHHLITNMPEHDPDIQNIPLFSTSPTFVKSIFSTFYNFEFAWDGVAEFLVPYQKYTYYPVMALARFNLYLLSWLHLLSPRAQQLGSAQWTRSVEIVFMACYWALFGYGLVWCTLPKWPIRIAFVLISHMITMLLHVQITLSHWGMPTSDLGPSESFPMRQLRTTMDVDCPPWLDFLHGGLQFQAVHHLFPRVPRHNLREVQGLVRAFCEKTEMTYQCYGFLKGNQVVLSRLEEVAKQVEIMISCQLDMAKTGESGLH